MRRVRVCPYCGEEYDTSVVECPRDGTDLLGEPVVTRSDEPSEGTVRAPRAEEPVGDALVLELVENPAIRFAVREGQTVGRTDKADVVLGAVPNGQYISSRMARFSRRGEQWYVQHIASTNYIEVDGERYEDDSEVALDEGAVLSLALAPFIVRSGAS